MGKRKAITVVQVALGVLVAAGLAWLVFKYVSYNQAQQVYRDIETAYASETPAASNGSGSAEAASPIDFAALQKDYPDVVGWLKMDDVEISYPIVQGSDNDYYLSHDPSGASNIDGAIFLDYRNKSLDTDLYALVYGHNMLDESMFGHLDEYTNEAFYQKGTDAFSIYTPKGSYRYKIFAVNIVDPTDDAYQAGFTNTLAFAAFVKQLKANSMYDTGVDVAGYDHVVTLSTCSDTNRLIISAKRID